MSDKLAKKLADLPNEPGVYFHKNASGEIIYIGKAAILRNRVKQYFQKSRYRDPKTDALVAEIADIDWITVGSEVDALFLEAELVRRYLPPYNILLRDDKSLSYIRITYKSDYPTVSMVRRPLDDGAQYFGPYLNGLAIKRALKYLRRAFPYATKKIGGQKRASLHYHLGLDPGLEDGRTSLADYRANLKKLMQYLKGERVAIIREIEREMKKASKAKKYEDAAKYRNQLHALNQLEKQVIFSDSEFMDLSKDKGLQGLSDLLGLSVALKRIEGFDISHMQGSDTVASMVVFSSGLPNKTEYRKFKMRIPGNDDFVHMQEVLKRRFSEKNKAAWQTPQLILIDGGKGQLSAALVARDGVGQSAIPMIGLAKREEEIVIKRPKLPEDHFYSGPPDITLRAKKMNAVVRESDDYLLIELPKNSDIVKLLQRIRDESHRFAVSYHSILKRTRQTASMLDEIPGIGPLTRKKLIRKFGSLRAVNSASEQQIADVIGSKKAQFLHGYISTSAKGKLN